MPMAPCCSALTISESVERWDRRLAPFPGAVPCHGRVFSIGQLALKGKSGVVFDGYGAYPGDSVGTRISIRGSAPRVERMLLQVVAELVVGEAERDSGAALVEVVRSQRLLQQLPLVGRDAPRKSPGAAGSAAGSGGAAAGVAGRCGEPKASKTMSPIDACGRGQR